MPIRILSPDENGGMPEGGDPRSITRLEYERGKSDFDNYYQGKIVNNSGTSFRTNLSLLTPFPMSELQALVQNELPAHLIDQAVIAFYHGYDRATGEVLRGLRVLTHSLKSDVENYYWFHPRIDQQGEPLPSHYLQKTSQQVQRSSGDWVSIYTIKPVKDPTEWSINQCDYYLCFKRHRSPMNATPVFDSMVMTEDPKAVVYPYKKEVLKLGTDTQSVVPGEILYYIISDFTTYLKSNEVPEIKGSEGYRHSLSIHMGYISGTYLNELLDSNNFVLTLAHKGIDYGHLCPPRCEKANFDRK